MKDIIKEHGFKYWFTNVLWYHYRIPIYVAAGIIALLVVMRIMDGDPLEMDFHIAVITAHPAFSVQGDMLGELLEQRGIQTHNLVLSLSGGEMDYMTFQQMLVVFVDHQYSLMITGASMLGSFADNLDAFYPMEDLGLPPSDIHPNILDLTDTPIIDYLFLNSEPMYALIKLPERQRNGTIRPENIARAEKSAAALRYMLEYPLGFE